MRTTDRRCQHNRRPAFTLVELLIVVAILLLLTTFVVSIFNANSSSDKMRSAARSAQSAFLGAKDRALHAFSTTKIASPANRRGIRLIRDSQDPSLITGFAYIQPIDVSPPLQYGIPVNNGQIRIDFYDPGTGTQVPRRVVGTGVDWHLLSANGVFPYPARIKIPADSSGQWYTFSNVRQVGSEVWLDLTTDFLDPDVVVPPTAVFPASQKASCEFDLGVEFLPNHQPIALPSGIVIDLDFSGRPALWRQNLSIPSAGPIPAGWVSLGQDPGNNANILIALANLDVMFSPRGAVTGAIAGTGPLYLLLNTIEDAVQNLNPIDPLNKGDKLVLAVFPQTGHVQAYPIDPTDSNNDSIADDLFRFAKLGSTAGQ